ncbi:class I SAM-dependent methyltransferase [Halovivax cerinus]|uniref:Class I SAM-dependent methyltransferase n=1 Tax=Halovivax cerinus TaxID=1487865 RepID=A0ABD5NRI0_9EURY|nr:class I SAM-dependent methyltransferase [Halovivax cerinus]
MDDVARTVGAYESAADAYAEKYLSQSAASRYGQAFLDHLDGGRVLDVGCGPGSDLAVLADAADEVVGLDITASFLRTAKGRGNGPLVRGDMRSLPLDADAVDGIWSSASFLHVPRADAAATLAEFGRVLRSDGVAFVSVKRRESGAPDGRNFTYYDPESFRTIVADAGFDVVSHRTIDHWISILARNRP